MEVHRVNEMDEVEKAIISKKLKALFKRVEELEDKVKKLEAQRQDGSFFENIDKAINLLEEALVEAEAKGVADERLFITGNCETYTIKRVIEETVGRLRDLYFYAKVKFGGDENGRL